MRVAFVVIAMLVAAPVAAQPAGNGSGSGSDEIEMEPEKVPPKPEPKPEPAKPDAPTDPDAATKDPKQARKFIATAQVLVQQADYFTRIKKPDDAKAKYESAATAYQRAIELSDDVNLHFDLGAVEEKLGKTDEAARDWRLLVKAANAKPDIQKKAQAKLDDALTKLALVTLVVKPEGATISLSTTQLGKAPLTDPLILMPGTYTFQLAADGFQPKELEIVVEAGSETERTVELEAVKVVLEPVKPKDPDADKPPPPPVPDKRPLYIGAGATGGLVLVATITGALAISKHGTFTSRSSSRSEQQDAQSAGRNLAHATDVFLVGAVAAGAFTAYWYRYKYQPSNRKYQAERPAKVSVVPWVQSDTGGFTLAGRF